MRRLILFLAESAVMVATALPSKKDVAAARDVVAELMADAVADTGGWKPVASGGGAGDWLRVRAPEGVEGGGELDWKGLGGVTYH